MTHHWGYVGAITSAIFFEMAATLNKIILEEVHSLVVAGLVYFVAGIVLFFVRLYGRPVLTVDNTGWGAVSFTASNMVTLFRDNLSNLIC